VLEFGNMDMTIVSPVYNYYAENILPKLGGIVSGQKEAYEYLQKSSAAFPSKENFLDLMTKTGQFSEMSFTPVSFGIAYIYIGTVK
jgi:demethylmenaquinone methyltransferase/2-methoxy-6-polyprenyl-1,4-benzoquinol methylase